MGKKVLLSLLLVLSLALTATYSPLSLHANYIGEASLFAADASNTVKDSVYFNEEVDGAILNQELQNQSVIDEAYSAEYKTNRFIVKFKGGEYKSSFVGSVREDLKQVRNFKNNQFKNFSIVTTKTKMRKEEFIAKVNSKSAGNNEIEYIQPDYKLTAASLELEESLPGFLLGLPPHDPVVEQWLSDHNPPKAEQKNAVDTGTAVEMADINIKAAWEASTGAGAIVAILDTGIDITHKDISQRIWTNQAEISGNGIDDDGNGYIDDTNGWDFSGSNNEIHKPGREYDEWHGTHIAGIIAGVSPEAKIMPLTVFQNGTAYTSDIIEAIAYAEKNEAKVANCSWGTSFDNPALKEAITKSAMLFICAAGNSNANIDINPVYPASYRNANIITTVSLNQEGNLSGFSNYGPKTVDVAAPGENIISAIPGDRYGKSSGTSQSAAFVSGEAALILGAYKNASAAGIRDAIIKSADQMPNLNNQVANGSKINLFKAVSYSIPAEALISTYNQGISVNESIYGNTSVSVIDSVYGETEDTEFSNEDIGDSESIYPAVDGYSLYSGEIWNIKTSMPTARKGLAVAEINGTIYALGGYNNGYLNKVEVYDPATNTWTAKANMPTAREWLAAAAANGKIYAIGGINKYEKLSALEEYDPATDTWTTKAPMPTPRCLLAAVAVNGKIYAIGGNNDGFLSTVEEYDPATNTWTTKAPMPTPRNYLAAAAANGKIYAVGGMTVNNDILRTVEEYDPATNTWTAKTGMSMPRHRLAAAAAGGRIYAVGGQQYYDVDDLNLVEEYNPPTNTWTTIASMPTARSLLAAAGTSNRVYTIGGNGTGNILNSVEELVLRIDDYGDDFASSTSIGTGSVIEGWIDFAYDIDFFNFTPTYNGLYAIESSGSTDMYGMLYNSNQERLSLNNDDGDNLNFRIVTNLQAGHTYYLKAGHFSNEIGPYEILISKLPDGVKAFPSNASTITVSWVPMPDASGYDIEVDGTVIDNGQNATYAHSGLVPNVLHEYRVRIKYGGIPGGWSQKLYSLTRGSWQIKASMPTPRYGLAAAAANEKIYAIGGSNNNYGGYLATVEEYNPATNTWTTKASMPTAREWLAAVTANGKIYAIGGVKYNYLSTVEEYNPATNTWTTKAPMPTPRCLLAAAAVNGKIYAIGGNSEGNILSTVEEYNPVTNTWTTKAPMPTPRNYLAVAVVNGKIYAIGGMSLNNEIISTVEEYDPATNTWTTKTGMPMPRSRMAAAAASERVYAVGGQHDYYDETLSLAEEYNPATNTWLQKINMPVKSYLLSAAEINGKVYAIGGYNSDGYLNTVQEYNSRDSYNYEFMYNENNWLRYLKLPFDSTIEYQYDNNGNLIRRMISQ